MRTWAALLLALLASSCDGADDDAVARIDGVAIPLPTLERVVERRAAEEPDSRRSDILLAELDRLVSEQVVLNRAAELGVKVSDDEVHARLRDLYGGPPEGVTDAYREEVRRQMTLDRTPLVELADRLHLSDDAVFLYFEEHRDEFREPERVQIRHILLQDAIQARQVLTHVEEGGDFAELAREFSRAPESNEGGLLPPFARGEMPEVFDQAFDQAPGTVSDVIESPFGFHLFWIESHIPAHDPTLEDVREKLRTRLEQERFQELRREWLRQLRRQAEITVDERALEDLR